MLLAKNGWNPGKRLACSDLLWRHTWKAGLIVLVTPGNLLCKDLDFQITKCSRTEYFIYCSWRTDSNRETEGVGNRHGTEWSQLSVFSVWEVKVMEYVWDLISELDLYSVGRILLNFNCCHDLAGVKKGIKRLSWRDRWTVMLWLVRLFCLCCWKKVPSTRSPHNEPQFNWKYILNASHSAPGQRGEPSQVSTL